MGGRIRIIIATAFTSLRHPSPQFVATQDSFSERERRGMETQPGKMDFKSLGTDHSLWNRAGTRLALGMVIGPSYTPAM